MTQLDVPLDHTPDPKRFIGWLRKLDGSKRTWLKFSDFVEMAYYATAKTMTRDATRRDELEARYMQIVETYDDKDDVRQYPKLLAYAQVATHVYGMDFLGQVAGELGALDAKSGQFFTPMNVSRMMAQVTLDKAYLSSLINKRGFFTMAEPAAGAGGMVMAVAEQVERLQFDVQTQMLAHAVELDAFVYKMCYLQLAWAGIPAYVENANSLSLAHYDGAHTPAVMLFYQTHGHIFPPRQKPAETSDEPSKARSAAPPDYDVTAPTRQLTLFDFGEEQQP
jgi:hypothetical protein